jgi:hypothetical protein
MWLFAQIFPNESLQVYELAKSKIQVPVPENLPIPSTEWFIQRPFEHNAFIAGYIGFLNLQELAGMDDVDIQLRQDVNNELNRLLQLKIDIFTKDSYWDFVNFRYKKHLDISRNFIYLVPELGEFMNQNILAPIQAMNEYEYIAPYWFVSLRVSNRLRPYQFIQLSGPVLYKGLHTKRTI